jgi:hypothetical protein
MEKEKSEPGLKEAITSPLALTIVSKTGAGALFVKFS